VVEPWSPPAVQAGTVGDRRARLARSFGRMVRHPVTAAGTRPLCPATPTTTSRPTTSAVMGSPPSSVDSVTSIGNCVTSEIRSLPRSSLYRKSNSTGWVSTTLAPGAADLLEPYLRRLARFELVDERLVVVGSGQRTVGVQPGVDRRERLRSLVRDLEGPGASRRPAPSCCRRRGRTRAGAAPPRSGASRRPRSSSRRSCIRS